MRRYLRRRRLGLQAFTKVVREVQDLENPHRTFKPLLRRFKGRSVKVYISGNGGEFMDPIEVDVPLNGFNGWWDNEFRRFSMPDVSGEDQSILTPFDEAKIVVVPGDSNLTPLEINQIYREGITNCLLTPIYNDLLDKFNSAQSTGSKNIYRARANKAKMYMEKYKDGVPEEALNDICNALRVSINLTLPFQNQTYLSVKPQRKAINRYNFINTRLNHLDFTHNNLVFEKPTPISQEALNEMGSRLDEAEQFFLWRKDNSQNYIMIKTLEGAYSRESDFVDKTNEFEFKNNIRDYKLDYMNDPVVEFIKQSIHFPGAIEFSSPDDGEYSHIDMEKAYSAGSSSRFYQGYLGKVCEWRKTDKRERVGIFKIDNLTLPENALLERLGLWESNGVYPSPELDYLDSIGATYKVVEGCWGSTFDLEWTKGMLDSKTEEKTPYYSIWTGKQFSFPKSKTFSMKGNLDFFRHLENHKGENCRLQYFNGVGEISYPIKSAFNAPHITSFILSYHRLNLLEQLEVMEYENLVAVVVDGIFYKGKTPEMKNVFRVKAATLSDKSFGEEFCSKYEPPNKIICKGATRPVGQKELFKGAGGNGKTHYNLDDKGLVRVLYVAPSYKLTSTKNKEYGVNTEVLANIISKDTEKTNFYKRTYSTFVFDEVSQYREGDKKRIFELYPECKLIFCGDLGFQLPAVIKPSERRVGEKTMNEEGFDRIVEFKKNYRFKDPYQLKACMEMRKLMEEDNSNEFLLDFLKKTYRQVSSIEDYDPAKDIILTSKTTCLKHNLKTCNCDGTNYSQEWLEKFGETKWKCIERNLEFNNGEIVVGEKPEQGKWEARQAFTIHSVQGETFKGRIFLDIRKMFERTMAYTAISRAQYWGQIYIIS